MPAPKGFWVDAKEITVRNGKHYIEACGCCGGYHPCNYSGDCRAGVNRYAAPEDYAERNAIAPKDVIEAYSDEEETDNASA